MYSPTVLVKKASTDIERKLWGGGVTAITATSVTAGLSYFGIDAPSWVPPLVAIVFYFVGGFLTKSAVPADTTIASQLGAEVAAGTLYESDIENVLTHAFEKQGKE